jgi:hypothetical protein
LILCNDPVVKVVEKGRLRWAGHLPKQWMMVNLEKTLPFGEPMEEEAEVVQN